MKHTVEHNFDIPPQSVIFGTSDAMKKVERDLAMIASADALCSFKAQVAPAKRSSPS